MASSGITFILNSVKIGKLQSLKWGHIGSVAIPFPYTFYHKKVKLNIKEELNDIFQLFFRPLGVPAACEFWSLSEPGGLWRFCNFMSLSCNRISDHDLKEPLLVISYVSAYRSELFCFTFSCLHTRRGIGLLLKEATKIGLKFVLLGFILLTKVLLCVSLCCWTNIYFFVLP
jgi:hypothetical protein